ncbi:MAG: hypothetical protein AABZ60_15755, partial [Planctomycetota bacterium]
YMPSPKNSIAPSKFDYVQYLSPEKLGLDNNLVLYDCGKLQNQTYLFGSSEPNSIFAFKFESLKVLSLDLKIKLNAELKKFAVLSCSQEITVFWQHENDLKNLFFCHFDGKTFSPEEKISFESELQHFFPFFAESSLFLIYSLQNDPKTIYFKKQNTDLSWPAQPQVFRFKESNLISSISSFSLCSVQSEIYLAISTSGIPILFQAKTLEATWELFKSETLNTPKPAVFGLDE